MQTCKDCKFYEPNYGGGTWYMGKCKRFSDGNDNKQFDLVDVLTDDRLDWDGRRTNILTNETFGCNKFEAK